MMNLKIHIHDESKDSHGEGIGANELILGLKVLGPQLDKVQVSLAVHSTFIGIEAIGLVICNE